MALTRSDVRAAMRDAGAKWKLQTGRAAAEALTVRGLGLTIDIAERISLLAEARDLEQQTFRVTAPPPAAIDWRNKGGRNYVTGVRNQKDCNSCVAFASCATVEARLNIAQGQPGREIDLSEADLFFCGGGSCGGGWQFPPALARLKDHGVGREANFPYVPAQQPCQNIAAAVKITDHSAASSTIARKQAISSRGPVIAGMKVFEDFQLHYAGGIYRQVAGAFVGNHAVCVVGYNDAQQCWIVKNSWGPQWGESGFFRIGYGECGIDSQFAFYDIEPVAIGPL